MEAIPVFRFPVKRGPIGEPMLDFQLAVPTRRIDPVSGNFIAGPTFLIAFIVLQRLVHLEMEAMKNIPNLRMKYSEHLSFDKCPRPSSPKIPATTPSPSRQRRGRNTIELSKRVANVIRAGDAEPNRNCVVIGPLRTLLLKSWPTAYATENGFPIACLDSTLF